MTSENIRDQVKRTEDLLHFYINRLKDRQELSEKLAIDHTDSSKRTRNEVIGGLGAFLGIIVSLFTIDSNNSNLQFLIIIMIIIIVIIYFAWNRRFKKLNDAFGLDAASYDQRIIPLENILKMLILMTINSYEGHFSAIREVATMISFLNDATALYNIEPTELLIQSKVFSTDINDSMKKTNELLKSEANYFYEQYQKLKIEYIPEEFRKVAEKVFLDNQKYIDQKVTSSVTES